MATKRKMSPYAASIQKRIQIALIAAESVSALSRKEGERGWRGIDRYNPDESLPPGFVYQCDNLYIEGAADGAGDFVVRPGKQGRLATALGAGIYSVTPVAQVDGTTHHWYVSGGTLYRLGPSDTVGTAVTLPTSLTAASGSDYSNVIIRQVAGYVYIADGVAGLMRVKPDGTGNEYATGLTKPSVSQGVTPPLANFSAGLTYETLVASPGAVSWGNDYFTTGTELIPEADQNVSTDGTNPTSLWNLDGGVTIGTNNATGGYAPRMDAVGEGFYTDPINTTAESTTYGLSSGTRYPYLMALRFFYGGDLAISDFPDNQNKFGPMKVTITAYSATAGGGSSVDFTQYVSPQSNYGKEVYLVFDLRTAGFDVKSIKLRCELAEYHNSSYKVEPNRFHITVPSQQLRTHNSNGNLTVSQGGILGYNQRWYAQGIEFEYAFGAAQDLRTVQSIAVKITPGAGVNIGFPLRLFLRDASVQTYAPEVYIPKEGGVFSFDLSEFTPALLDGVTHIGFQFAGDVESSEAVSSTERFGNAPSTQLATFGTITLPGNLPEGNPIYYRVVEVKTSTDATKLLDVVYSDGSDPTTVIYPTSDQARAKILLPGRTNSSAGYFAVYRFGDFDDGLGRLVAFLPFGVTANNIAYGADIDRGTAPYYAAPKNPYIAMTYPAVLGNAGGILIDNTPPSFLYSRDYFRKGREVAPLKIRDLCEWDGRLWAIADSSEVSNRRRSELFASWLLSADSNAGLYWTRVQDPSDPEVGLKGWYGHVGTEDNDRALRLLPTDDRMTVLMERKSPYFMMGAGGDPLVYQLIGYKGSSSSLNLAAPRAAGVFRGKEVYLTPNGVVEFSLSGEARRLSDDLTGVLTPNLAGGGSALANLSKCVLGVHGGNLYLAAPVAGGSDNSVIYRYDPRQGGGSGSWSVWLQGNVSSITATEGVSDNNQLYVGGLDGQVYRYVPGEGDKALSTTSPATAITFTLRTARYGGKWGLGRKDAQRVLWEVENGNESVALTLGVGGDVSAAAWSQSYTLAANTEGVGHVVNCTTQNVWGRYLYASISGAVTKYTRIGEFIIEYALGSDRLSLG